MKAANREWNSSSKRSALQPTKLNGFRHLKSVLSSDMEMQSLEFAQLVFSLALVQYFHSAPFPMFWNGNVYLCHYLLEVCDLLFDFDFTGDYS